jgi:hypothetical protein
MYSLIYLAEGTLPWLKLKIQNQADMHKILLLKKSLNKKLLKQNIPNQLFYIID